MRTPRSKKKGLGRLTGRPYPRRRRCFEHPADNFSGDGRHLSLDFGVSGLELRRNSFLCRIHVFLRPRAHGFQEL